MKQPVAVLTLALVAALPLAQAQSAAQPAEAAPAASADSSVDPRVLGKIDEMGAYLRTLKQFEAEADVHNDVVAENGQKVQLMGTIQYKAMPPTGLRASIHSDRAQRDYWYDGKTLTILAPRLGFYSSIDAPPTIRELVSVAEGDYGIEMPLADLFLWGTDREAQAPITTALYVGPGKIDNDVVDQYILRQGTVDWQVWIARGDRPLPRRLVMTANDDPARPSYTAAIRWNLSPGLSRADFQFKPPSDGYEIALVPAGEATASDDGSQP
ncbi:DUF2092 domain-containing protein [Novilysobacter selenitireducens]|uniref:DUF2092 domain-containing protein n=1 Tax=Novilysobacter selenitireducens TaxID=2872639 RepID=A0ABS7T5H2_9GAMM|nr:DUF2092 domain-containing protein [Lysobacter selenitireducens]MBZ4039115.1 DUF2092 domain-containing protein [Lysobacter selenitireducens]